MGDADRARDGTNKVLLGIVIERVAEIREVRLILRCTVQNLKFDHLQLRVM